MLLLRRWMKQHDVTVAVTVSPCFSRVASIVVDSPRTQFFYMSRKNVTVEASRNIVLDMSTGMIPFAL